MDIKILMEVNPLCVCVNSFATNMALYLKEMSRASRTNPTYKV